MNTARVAVKLIFQKVWCMLKKLIKIKPEYIYNNTKCYCECLVVTQFEEMQTEIIDTLKDI